MKKNIAILLLILSCVIFYLAYNTANKEIGRTTIAGGGQMRSLKITPFNYDKYSQETQELNRLFDMYSGNNNGAARQNSMEKKAGQLKSLTYILALGGIVSIVIALNLFSSVRKSKSEITDKINIDEELKE
jgi:ABC-type xylose transport system permease subunit